MFREKEIGLYTRIWIHTRLENIDRCITEKPKTRKTSQVWNLYWNF